MTDLTNDTDILAALKRACAEFNYSPSAFISFARNAAEWQRTAVIPNFGPYPRHIDEGEITQEILAGWPEWVEDLVPAGSKWERLHWPDGSTTVRLVDPRALVLAAKHLGAREGSDDL